MTDIQVGDYIKATQRANPKVTATDTIEKIGRSGTVFGSYSNFTQGYWDFEVIERPYTLPTEPGLYTLTDIQEEVVYTRVFRLNDVQKWQELTAPGEFEREDAEKELMRHKWNMKQLVIKED